MRQHLPAHIAGILATILSTVTAGLAQPAYVFGEGEGQGFVFRDAGACWLITAGHVVGKSGGAFRLVMEGAPPLEGGGIAYRPFWNGLDLAVGVVEGSARNSCSATRSDLDRGWPQAVGQAALRIANMSPQGRLSYDPMQLDTVPNHRSFTARFPTDPEGSRRAEARQGRSGGFLFLNDRPMGMAVTNPETGVHGFIRIEEIAMNVARYLDWQGETLVMETEPTEARQPAGFDVRVQSTTLSPVLGSRQDDLIAASAPFIFDGSGEIVLEILSEERRELRGVRITSLGDEARPKDITILTTSSRTGRGNRLPFHYGRMTPGGVFETPERTGVPMRRVIVAIGSAWGTGPRRIDKIELY